MSISTTPPTPEQLVRRARFRAWVERNWHLLGKPWPGTEEVEPEVKQTSPLSEEKPE